METFAKPHGISVRNRQPCSAGLRCLGWMCLLVICVAVALGGWLIAALWRVLCSSPSFMLHTR